MSKTFIPTGVWISVFGFYSSWYLFSASTPTSHVTLQQYEPQMVIDSTSAHQINQALAYINGLGPTLGLVLNILWVMSTIDIVNQSRLTDFENTFKTSKDIQNYNSIEHIDTSVAQNMQRKGLKLFDAIQS